MPKPLSLDEVANEMQERQNNPTSNAAAQTVWDPERGIFVQLAPGERLGAKQTPLNTLAKEPYFCSSQKRLVEQMEIKALLEVVEFLRYL